MNEIANLSDREALWDQGLTEREGRGNGKGKGKEKLVAVLRMRSTPGGIRLHGVATFPGSRTGRGPV